MSVVSLQDTDELRQLAQQIYRLEHDPRRPGPLDFVLAVAASTALLTLGVCLLILTVAPDRFPVERGRIVLTLAAAAIIVAPVLGAIFGLNRANRKRFDAAMERLSQLTEYVRKLSEARQTAAVGYSTYFQQLEIKLDLMAIQIEQLEGKTEKVTEQSQALLSGLVDRVEREMAANQESLPIAAVQELAKDVYRLARRQRKADED